MVGLIWLWTLIAVSVAGVSVWPQPTFLESGHQVLRLSSNFKILTSCENGSEQLPISFRKNLLASAANFVIQEWLRLPNLSNSWNTRLTEADILRNAVSRSKKAVTNTRFVPWKFYPRHSNFEPTLSGELSYLRQLQIKQRNCSSGQSFDPTSFIRDDESYEISIEDGLAEIKTNTTLGTIRALESFQQLFYMHSSGTYRYLRDTPLRIFDSPKWSHRGLSLDIARNVFAPEDVMRTIDAMASVKLSRLHVHATDSQSWPIEIPALPALAAKGAYQSHLTWSPKDLERVQSFGIQRGVSVFLEIDMPGHTASVAPGYPDLVAAYNEPDWSNFAAEPQSGQLKLNSSAVYEFLNTLFSDILPRVSQYTPIYHAGGDEVNMNVHLLDDSVRSNAAEVLQPLLQKFIDHVLRLLADWKMQPILWEEMLLDWNLTLPSANRVSSKFDVIIQVWRDSKNLVRVLEKGHRVLFGDHEYWYLDCGFGSFTNPYPGGSSPPGIPYNSSGGIPSRLKRPYLDYCSPMSNWRHIYTYDPLINITSDLQHLIEGGEVLLWSEQTDAIDLDPKLWPRAAAAAEVLWSGPRLATMIDGASNRLGEWRERAVIDHGIRSEPVQMTWCLMEGGCLF